MEAPASSPKPLPCIHPTFTLRRLGKEPEDPILTHVTVESLHTESTVRGLIPVAEEVIFCQSAPLDEDLWTSIPNAVTKDNILSWDNFQRPPASTEETPYVSESRDSMFGAYRFYVLPYVKTEGSHRIHIFAEAFHRFMALNLFGNSSALFNWDRTKDAFRFAGAEEGAHCTLSVEAISEISVSSILKRFLLIGTMLRRIEEIVLKLRAESPGTAVASFAHGLANIIEHMHSTSLPRIHSVHPKHLLSLWSEYEELEDTLLALACLCNRGPERSPPFPPFPTGSSKLTSRVYEHLSTHIRLNSSHAIRRDLAYLLTATSRDTFRRIGESIGLVTIDAARRTVKDAYLSPHDEDDSLLRRKHSIFDNLPSFISAELSSHIDRARRSLELLRVAKPDHPACHRDDSWEALCVGFLWSESDLEDLVNSLEKHVRDFSSRIDNWRPQMINPDDQRLPSISGEVNAARLLDASPQQIVDVPKNTLDVFKLFDMEPGAHFAQVGSSSQHPSISSYGGFIRKYPEQLPLSAPTLRMLMETTCLQPLLAHAQILSSSLLDLFLSDLDFLSHVDLLHRFLLMGDPSFASRLRHALFIEERDEEDSTGRLRSRSRSRSKRIRRKGAWGVGLNPHLNDRGTWPPGGSELAFSLRRVIVDTLDEARLEAEDGERKTGGGRQRDSIWSEGEWRLGFVIKPAEADDQNEASWLDPTTVHALDFLDMDYKSPETLLTLLSPPLLEKYKRVFAFLLKLLRVDTVSRMLYRFTRTKISNTFSSHAAQLALHTFVFESRGFISSFMSYVEDCAIGSRHNAFTERLLKLTHGVPDTRLRHRSVDDYEDEGSEDLSDIFSVLTYHMKTMDDILEACLLKARHRTVAGAIVEECLQTILDFGQLVSDVAEGQIMAETGEQQLLKLHRKFRNTLRRLLDGLKQLIERGQGKRTGQTGLDIRMDGISKRDQELIARYSNMRGDSRSFREMLLRLDVTGWYVAPED